MDTRIFKSRELLEIAQRIVCAVDPDFIICYGCRTIETNAWSAFTNSGSGTHSPQTTYDLLIVTPQDCKHQDNEVVQIVEQQFAHPLHVNCIVHKIGYVNEAIRAKNRHYYLMLRYGAIIQESGKEIILPFSGPPELTDSIDWDRWFVQAQRFLSMADHAFSFEYYQETLFLLHQAMEQTCVALLRFFTGYQPNTHNLPRLLTMTEAFSHAPRSIFPGTTKEEVSLLALLNKAYYDSRYKETFATTRDKVEILRERVKAFLAVADTLHSKGVHSMDLPWTVYGAFNKADP